MDRMIEYNGEVHTLSEWSRKLGIGINTLRARLHKQGLSVEIAFTAPVRGGAPIVPEEVRLKCVWCGKEFFSDNRQKKYCSEECLLCAMRKRRNENAKLARRLEKEAMQPPVKEEPSIGLREMVNRALEAGMSYGKYVASSRM